jgi:hypothetical protein
VAHGRRSNSVTSPSTTSAIGDRRFISKIAAESGTPASHPVSTLTAFDWTRGRPSLRIRCPCTISRGKSRHTGISSLDRSSALSVGSSNVPFITVEQIGGDDLVIIVGGMGERTAPVAVAECSDAGDVGLKTFVDHDIAAQIERSAGARLSVSHHQETEEFWLPRNFSHSQG